VGNLWRWLERIFGSRTDADNQCSVEAVTSVDSALGAEANSGPAVDTAPEWLDAREAAAEPERSIADYLIEKGYASAGQIANARWAQDESGSGRKLAEHMLEKGYASPEQIEEARKAQQSTKGDFAKILIDLGLSSRDVYESKAQEMQVPFVDLTVYKPDQSAIDAVPYAVAARHNILPIKKDGTMLYVAIADLNNITANDDLRLASGCIVRGVLAVPGEITASIDRLYGLSHASEPRPKGAANESEPKTASDSGSEDTASDSTHRYWTDEAKTSMAQAMAEYAAWNSAQIDLDAAGRQETEDAPIVRLANMIVQQAIKERASEIHIEPDRRGMCIRHRIDGVLREAIQVPKFIQSPLLGRYAMMAEFNLATHRGKPQRGLFEITYRDQSYLIQLGATPTPSGDKLTLKIAAMDAARQGMNKLGFTPEVQARLEELAQRQSGLLLFAGPHGSGVSTTQYGLLNKLNSVERSLLTIEPYSSFRLPGVTQVDLLRRRGLTYRDIWRAACDVDVLHIDRVSNKETADLAVSAAEAGTLVLAAIDGADAVSALMRFTEFGISADRVGRSVRGVLAQHLVRRICTNCKEFYDVRGVELRRFGFKPFNSGQSVQLARGRGCETCFQSGYKGRIGIFELLVMNAEIADLVARCGSTERLEEAARGNGMHLLCEDGLVKVLEGMTTTEQVMQVLSL